VDFPAPAIPIVIIVTGFLTPIAEEEGTVFCVRESIVLDCGGSGERRQLDCKGLIVGRIVTQVPYNK